MPAWNSDNVVVAADLFDLCRIRYWAAKYRIAVEESEYGVFEWSDPLVYIFGDVWSRAEFEFVVRTLGGTAERKTDLFDLYVKPNRFKLLNMIQECSITSARQYIRDYNKKHPTK